MNEKPIIGFSTCCALIGNYRDNYMASMLDMWPTYVRHKSTIVVGQTPLFVFSPQGHLRHSPTVHPHSLLGTDSSFLYGINFFPATSSPVNFVLLCPISVFLVELMEGVSAIPFNPLPQGWLVSWQVFSKRRG